MHTYLCSYCADKPAPGTKQSYTRTKSRKNHVLTHTYKQRAHTHMYHQAKLYTCALTQVHHMHTHAHTKEVPSSNRPVITTEILSLLENSPCCSVKYKSCLSRPTGTNVWRRLSVHEGEIFMNEGACVREGISSKLNFKLNMSNKQKKQFITWHDNFGKTKSIHYLNLFHSCVKNKKCEKQHHTTHNNSYIFPHIYTPHMHTQRR